MPTGIPGSETIPTCHPDRKHQGKGLCKQCYGKLYRKEHPDTRTDRRDFAYRFGLTEEQYRDRREKQRREGDLCGICRKPLPKDTSAHLDHNHETGELREFVHKECNMAIGLLRDDPVICRLAAEYLEKYKGDSMAYTTADGKKKFGSSYVGKRYDAAHSEEPSDEKDAKKKLGNVLEDKAGDLAKEAGSEDMAGEGKKDVSQHPVVAQHGKATTVHIKHDHTANKHHVTSTHEDGHTNESDHVSDVEAHAEGSKLAGVPTPDMGAEEQDADLHGNHGAIEDDGFEMPGL